MKSIVVATLLFLPFFGFAQDSCQLKKETDAFTHQTKISTGFLAFNSGSTPVSISVDATPGEIDFFFWFPGNQKCFDDQSTVQINFEGDRLKSNFKNTGSMNCEGAFHFSFKNTASTHSQLQRLADKRVNSIKITGANKTVSDIVLSNEQKDLLRRMAACVIRDSKTLLKK